MRTLKECRIESEIEVNAYLANLKYALEHGAQLTVQMERQVDVQRELRYTNRFTITDLFPNEDPYVAIRKELMSLKVENYIQTVKDIRFPKRSEMREFGKTYNGKDDVYIKIRVELLATSGLGEHTTFVMSFHYAMVPFGEDTFPYGKRGNIV